MEDMHAHLEKLRAQAAECELIRDLATEPQKRELFDRLARHHRELAKHVENEIALQAVSDPVPALRQTAREG